MELKIFKGYERFDDLYPSEQVKYALEHKDEAIPELLYILEYTVNNAEKLYKDNKYWIKSFIPTDKKSTRFASSRAW